MKKIINEESPQPPCEEREIHIEGGEIVLHILKLISTAISLRLYRQISNPAVKMVPNNTTFK
jgi:hypothetical protein